MTEPLHTERQHPTPYPRDDTGTLRNREARRGRPGWWIGLLALLPIACCGLPLLLAAGVTAGSGAVLGGVAGAVLMLVGAAVLGFWGRRRRAYSTRSAATSPATTPACGPGSGGGTRRLRLGVVGAVVGTLLVLAVAYTAFGSQPSAPPGSASSAAGSGNAATAFTATTLSGEKVSIPGGKPSVVFFFAASCVTCGSGARAVAEAQAGVPGVRYVAVDIDPRESEAVVRDFLADNGAETLAFTRDTDAELAVAFKVTQLSTAIVLDSSGSEVYRVVHPTASKLRSALAGAGAE